MPRGEESRAYGLESKFEGASMLGFPSFRFWILRDK